MDSRRRRGELRFGRAPEPEPKPEPVRGRVLWRARCCGRCNWALGAELQWVVGRAVNE